MGKQKPFSGRLRLNSVTDTFWDKKPGETAQILLSDENPCYLLSETQ